MNGGIKARPSRACRTSWDEGGDNRAILQAAGGALVGGTAGAATGTSVDLYNRQLDPKEKTLAQQLADASGGRYTVAQIEDQLRQMDMSANGTTVLGTPATLVGQMPTDSGAQWMSAGTTANGQPILTQIMAQSNPALQSYILANYNSVSSGQVPSEFTYSTSSGNGGSINVTGPFTNFDQSDLNYVRSTTADATSMILTNAGRFGAATAAAASVPTPYSPALATASYVATVVGFGADVIGQAVKPDVGQYSVVCRIDIRAWPQQLMKLPMPFMVVRQERMFKIPLTIIGIHSSITGVVQSEDSAF